MQASHWMSTGGRKRLTLTQYLRFRLGSRGGKTAWFNFFIKPFGATSFAQFWRLWNPVYGYFLYYYSYRPLSRVMPRAGAMLATFVACGFFVHDLPAWVFSRRILPLARRSPFSYSHSVRLQAIDSTWTCRVSRSRREPPSTSFTLSDASSQCL
jgi:hypothetical protein